MELAGRFRIASLGSSSVGGNSYVIEHITGQRLLVDCGVGLRRTLVALDRLGVEPTSIGALLLTHEHTDHTRSLRLKRPLPSRFGIPVYATQGTWRALRSIGPVPDYLCRVLPYDQVFIVGELSVFAFATSHDVNQPAGFVVTDGAQSVGLATDLGLATPGVYSALQGCDYLVLESNHDVTMLLESRRPPFLKERVLGDRGHLSNEQAAVLAARLATRRTQLVVLAHLSMECNTPEKALVSVRSTLRDSPFRGNLVAAPRLDPSGWYGGDGLHHRVTH